MRVLIELRGRGVSCFRWIRAEKETKQPNFGENRISFFHFLASPHPKVAEDIFRPLV